MKKRQQKHNLAPSLAPVLIIKHITFIIQKKLKEALFYFIQIFPGICV